MITSPQGTAVGLPNQPASSCASAPPPLFAGGPAASASPIQSPLQVAMQPVGGGYGAPVVPTNAAAAAGTGAASLIGGSAAGVSVSPIGSALPILTPTIAATTVAPVVAPATAPATPAVADVAAAPNATAATAPQRLTSLAPGGLPGDADLVEQTLGVLRQSPAGSQIVDRMLAVGARVNVISDAEFSSMGHGDAHAFYDPKIDTMFLRRSDLADASNRRFAAVALAHEGTHLLDDVGKLADPFVRELTGRVGAAGGLESAGGIAARDQGLFELMMIKETRAFVYAGQVARELGMSLPQSDPTSTAIAGGNDTATYGAVWQRLLQSSYNEQGRSAAVRNF